MTVFLDFDGTLCDTFPIICQAMAEIREENGLPALHPADFDVVKGKIGLSTKEYVQLLVGPDNVEQNVCSYMEKALKALPPFFPGIEEMLRRLKEKGLRLVIATNKQQRIISPILQRLHCGDLFDEVRGVDYVTYFPKPHPSELSGDGKRVFVGDTATDRLTAMNAGCPFIGVTYGLETREQLEEGSYAVVDNAAELEFAVLRCLGFAQQ